MIGASCPATKFVIGSGAQITNSFGRVVLDRVDIKPDLSSVTASGSEVEGGTSAQLVDSRLRDLHQPLSGAEPGAQRRISTR